MTAKLEMRLATTICVVLAIAGCTAKAQTEWQRTEHSLTPEQTERQQQIIKDGKLLFEYEAMVGVSASDYSELLSLANVTGMRESEKLYTFTIPGTNDDGSDASFHIVTDQNRITKAEYWQLDY